MTLIAITNPSDEAAQAGIVHDFGSGTMYPERILELFGDKLEDGAQVTMVDGGSVWQYLATRLDDSIALRSNNALGDGSFIDYMEAGDANGEYMVTSAWVPLASSPEAELETFTVIGVNDAGEDFVAVVSATEDTVRDVGVQAACVGGYEDCVHVDVILKGEHSDLERV